MRNNEVYGGSLIRHSKSASIGGMHGKTQEAEDEQIRYDWHDSVINTERSNSFKGFKVEKEKWRELEYLRAGALRDRRENAETYKEL